MARGGRGGGGRNPANQPREVQVSKKISWLLRHGASSEGLKLGKGGYVNVQDAVSLRHNITFSMRVQFLERCKIGECLSSLEASIELRIS
jgi:RNA:NAD 2'-phosphotransferase (TPT1/KptA family)